MLACSNDGFNLAVEFLWCTYNDILTGCEVIVMALVLHGKTFKLSRDRYPEWLLRVYISGLSTLQ